MSSTTVNSGSVKVLTVGAAYGAFRELFAKIKSIDTKHGKFDFVLCVGDFFGVPKESENGSQDEELKNLLDGEIEAPLELLIMQGEHPLPQSVVEKAGKSGGYVAKNIFLLQKFTVMTTASNLRIACLGGIYDSSKYDSDLPQDFSSPYFTKTTVDKLLSNTTTPTPKHQNFSSLGSIKEQQLIDVLITNAWPTLITQLSNAPLPAPDLALIGAPPLDHVVRTIKPRYHFAAGGGEPPKFWEREPFVWDAEEGRTTRFLSLGAFGGEPVAGKKQRWFYAFSIAPHTNPPTPTPRPANATKNPFAESQPPKRPPAEGEPDNYIWGNVDHPGKRHRASEKGKPRAGYKCRKCDSTEHFIDDCPERAKPPDDYICKRCNNPGHFVRDCPTKHQMGDTGGKKPPNGYVCRGCASSEHYLDDCPVITQGGRSTERRGGKRGPPREIGPEECWFCLSNPSLAKHLIVSIGSECYVTLPKGQIVPTHTQMDHANVSSVPGGGHVLIVPIAHFPTMSSIAPDLAGPAFAEIDRYKVALKELYAKSDAVPVFFEVARHSAKGGHAHIQTVPIPSNLGNRVEDAFTEQGKMQGIEFESDPEAALSACRQESNRGYFRVDLPDGRKMVHLMQDHVPFSVQFGRQVLVTLLRMPDRLDWKQCALSEDEDRADALAFKTAFAQFDPTL